MDTKTLVVGQDVYMSYGPYGNKGKVVKVTPEGVEVLTEAANEDEFLRGISAWPPELQRKFIAANKAKLLRFDNEGNELEESRRDRLDLESRGPGDRFYAMLWNAPEFQPWKLDDNMPFEERAALDKHFARKTQR